MAVRGAAEKQIVIDKILEIFPDAFIYGKDIRVPVGEVQIKIGLTCAKDNVELGEDQAIPGAKVVVKEGAEPAFKSVTEEKIVEPTKEELDTVSSMMAAMANLGF